MGVVGVIAPQDSSLIGLVSTVIPIIVGGNTVVVLASEKLPLCAVTFAEVLKFFRCSWRNYEYFDRKRK
jgi:acyl-CoA reductase-like NAD-dependent aldehyde dehydrogenase